MPLQNRIDPFGDFHAVDTRGGYMGNRGILHDEQKKIIAPWRGKAWVTCLLGFKGIKREVFSKNSYSELFFLDEATAFSAGHRPCNYCQRDRFKAFKTAWLAANHNLLPSTEADPSITLIDQVLHTERAVRGGAKVKFTEQIQNIPDGTFVEINGAAFLVSRNALVAWSFAGYARPVALPDVGTVVQVLTPKSIVSMFRQGFLPQIHNTAGV
jgi:hypothetical protein